MGFFALRPVTGQDLALMMQWRQEKAMLAYNPLEQVNLAELSRRLVDFSHDLSDHAAANYHWMVTHDDNTVGHVSLRNVNRRMGLAEIGYSIGEEHQGKGYGSAAVALVVAKAFTETFLRKLIAYVAADNTASCRILGKLGFIREGLLREHYIIAGQPRDEVLFGLLRGEWSA